jgi:hypothetical protein
VTADTDQPVVVKTKRGRTRSKASVEDGEANMSEAMGQPEGAGETSLKRRAWRAWRVFSWGRRVLSAPDWLQWGWAAFQTKAGVAVATGTVAAGALGTVALVAPDLVPWSRPADPPSPPAVVLVVPPPPAPAPLVLEPPAPVEAAPQKLAGESTLFALSGADSAGRKASFELVLLSKAITWVRGSTSEIARDGEDLSEEQVVDEVIGSDVRGRLSTSQEIIAAGAASAEGDVDTENERAGERAVTTSRTRQARFYAQPRPVPGPLRHRRRGGRHGLAAAAADHRRDCQGGWRTARRSAARRHERQGQCAEPVVLFAV